MEISVAGLKLIEQFEGFSSRQYRDSVGVPTIGFGTTAADISPLPTSCTRAQAEAWLRSHVQSKYAPAVNALGVPLNQNQFDALCSLAYNVGPGVFGWQIGHDLRAKNYHQASADFMHYTHAGGQVLQGLVNRRAAERKLFDTPVHKSDPYGIFVDTTFVLHGVKINERKTVREYDEAHRHGKGASLRGNVAFLRNRLWLQATLDSYSEGHKAWTRDNRLPRYAGLCARAPLSWRRGPVEGAR